MPVDTATQNWNDALIADFRAHQGLITTGPMAGASLVLLTTTGAKTGQPRTSPLAYTRDGARYVVVASNSGQPTHPAWLANVESDPRVTVEVGGETFRARATIVDAAERRRLFDVHAAAMPGFATYETMTDRVIPVVTLERLAED